MSNYFSEEIRLICLRNGKVQFSTKPLIFLEISKLAYTEISVTIFDRCMDINFPALIQVLAVPLEWKQV